MVMSPREYEWKHPLLVLHHGEIAKRVPQQELPCFSLFDASLGLQEKGSTGGGGGGWERVKGGGVDRGWDASLGLEEKGTTGGRGEGGRSGGGVEGGDSGG